jgi:phosphocarrier protein
MLAALGAHTSRRIYLDRKICKLTEGAVVTRGVPLPIHKAVVSASIGLHARPAAVFVRAVTDTGLPVTISKAGIDGVDARSLLEVMTADFHYGCEVELSIKDSALEGPYSQRTAEEALRMLAQLIEAQGAR